MLRIEQATKRELLLVLLGVAKNNYGSKVQGSLSDQKENYFEQYQFVLEKHESELKRSRRRSDHFCSWLVGIAKKISYFHTVKKFSICYNFHWHVSAVKEHI